MILSTYKYFENKNNPSLIGLRNITSVQAAKVCLSGVVECLPLALGIIAYMGLFGKISPPARQATLGGTIALINIFFCLELFLLYKKREDEDRTKKYLDAKFGTKQDLSSITPYPKFFKINDTSRPANALSTSEITIKGQQYLQVVDKSHEPIKVDGNNNQLLLSLDKKQAYLLDATSNSVGTAFSSWELRKDKNQFWITQYIYNDYCAVLIKNNSYIFPTQIPIFLEEPELEKKFSFTSLQQKKIVAIALCSSIPLVLGLIAYFGVFGKLQPKTAQAILGSAWALSGVLLILEGILVHKKFLKESQLASQLNITTEPKGLIASSSLQRAAIFINERPYEILVDAMGAPIIVGQNDTQLVYDSSSYALNLYNSSLHQLISLDQKVALSLQNGVYRLISKQVQNKTVTYFELTLVAGSIQLTKIS